MSNKCRNKLLEVVNVEKRNCYRIVNKWNHGYRSDIVFKGIGVSFLMDEI